MNTEQSKTKILFVGTNPFIFGGVSQATRAYLDSVLDIYNRKNVDVVIPYESNIPRNYSDINFIKIKKRSKCSSILYIFFGVLGRFAMPVTKYIKRNKGKYSMCIINGGKEGGWIARRINSSNIKTVVIHHNQEVEYCMDNLSIYTLGNKWPYTVKKQENNAYKFSDINLFLTKDDMQAFNRMYGNNNGVNKLIGCYDFKDATIIKPYSIKKKYDLVISGSLSTYQTVHGVLNFLDNYFSLSKKIIPDVKILLTGRTPTEQIKQIVDANNSNYELVESPIDIMAEVQKASIYLCPTDIGGGLKLRVMDGLKSGLPILVHKVSSRGYDSFFDKPYFQVYYDKKTFEEGLRNIINYMDTTSDYGNIINKDYYNYFGYSSGTERMRLVLK
jgi:glycosyltransferase involved in cell wall biosynthesis